MAQKILIVQSDPFLTALLKTRLMKDGFEVGAATDGEQGQQMLKEMKPDLLVLDIILLKRSGFEILEALRADEATKNLPVIVVTALGQQEDVEKGKKYNLVDYIVKSRMSLDDLIKKVHTALQSAPIQPPVLPS
jgi:DNA-binding response OmpR family regulator